MKFILSYPDTYGADADMLDVGPLAEVAVAAENAGWHGFAVTDHPAPGANWLRAGGHQTLDPLVALGYIAATTARIRLITYLAIVPYRNPLLLAKSAATVDLLSGGRLTLGAGGRLPEVGVPRPRCRLRRAERAVRRSADRDASALVG